MADPKKLRLAAILWFVAAALSLTAALITWSDEGVMNWPPLAAASFMAILGGSMLRRSRSGGD